MGNRAVTRLLARQPVTWSGSVFLPGDENVGHRFTLEGTSIVEKTGRTKRTVGTIAADGRYTLVDEKGNPVPGGAGSVSDLIGQVTEKGGANPGVVTSTTGTGDFTVWDADDKKHSYTIKDGGVFETVGKRRDLVGDVDATGRYRVNVAGHVTTGSLTDQWDPTKRWAAQDAKFKRTAGDKTLGQLQIGVDPVPEGILVFHEGTYTVKDGQLFQPGSKRPVGRVTIVRSGPKLENLSLPVWYEEHFSYPGGAGETEHSTDIAKYVPDAGSVLRLGNGRDWIVSDGKTWQPMSGAPVKRGYELFGGGRLTPKLKALRAAGKIQVTDDEINEMQGVAEVESGGFTNCINTWDSDVLSLGFMQYTMAGSLQELIEAAPGAFARYGIRLGPSMKLTRSDGTITVKGVQGIKSLKELRGLEWATRFFRAGLDDDVIAAQVAKAKADFAKITARYLSSLSAVPHFSQPRIKAIIFELYNNRPAYVGAVVAATAAEIKKHPRATTDDVVGFLKDAMETQYVNKNVGGINGDTDDEARKKARDIITRTGLPFANP
jgi:hypothetical protein